MMDDLGAQFQERGDYALSTCPGQSKSHKEAEPLTKVRGSQFQKAECLIIPTF